MFMKEYLIVFHPVEGGHVGSFWRDLLKPGEGLDASLGDGAPTCISIAILTLRPSFLFTSSLQLLSAQVGIRRLFLCQID